MGRQQRKHMKLTAAWQMKTTRRASAYESTAAWRSSGASVGIMVVECLQACTVRILTLRGHGDETSEAHRIFSIIWILRHAHMENRQSAGQGNNMRRMW